MTPSWSTRDLVEATGGAMVTDFAATGVSIDTRTLAPGDLFVALHGDNGDGHAFVAAALAKGAAGAMVHDDLAGDTTTAGRLLRVDDTLAALTRLGAYARARFTGRLVAVTGSVGKTTTKEMLRRILGAFAPTHAAVASYNNHWGVPLTLARLPPDGVAVLPLDNPLFPLLREAAADMRVVTFGAHEDADACLIAAEADAEGTDLHVRVDGTEAWLRIDAPGRHMAMNAVAALATASAALGADVRMAADALAGFAPIAGRGARRAIAIPGGTTPDGIVPGGAALLLDESYNGNGASMRAALEVLRLQPARRRLAVLGDMLELGDEGPAEHSALADAVTRSADLLFTCGPLMRWLYDAVPERMRAVHAGESTSLAPLVARAVRPGDAILVKGSLGMRMKRVVDALDTLGSSGALGSSG